ncbi:hypothetical protein [Limnobacter sp.]|uniref:hypothetical protein n=1 Tax=Limnobacter sp. TaxID=2003368 RepID=UPI00351574B7
MNSPASTFHEDHLRRRAQSLQLAFTRALNGHDGSTPLYLHQEMDFLGHFEPDAKVSLAMLPQVMQQDPVAGVMMMTVHLDAHQSSTLVSAVERGALTSALLMQLFGPNNLPGNLANLIEALVKARFTGKLQKEFGAMMASGKARTVKLGNGVELKVVGLKGPNQFGKHADVMLRIRQPNAKQITLLEKHQYQAISKNIRSKSLGKDAFKYGKVQSLSRQMSDELWELRRLQGAPWLGSIKAGGALAFAPTLITDVLNNYNHHAKLDQKFNYKQFAVDSVKNQTGNALALAGGYAAGVSAAVIFGLAGAPLVVIGLLSAVFIGVFYDTSDLKIQIEHKAQSLFGNS